MHLLDSTLLPKLDCLSLVARRARAGQTVGERRSTRRGASSVEFADYRNYTQGDDLRRVDWNIYARLERPFVKLFEEEEDLAVHILLDGSGSMEWGGGAREQRSGGAGEQGRGRERGIRQGEKETRGQGDGENKWVYARRLAAALGYIALVGGDHLTVTLIPRPQSLITSRLGPMSGRGHVLRLFEWLEDLVAGGTTDLNAALRAYALSGGRAGLMVLLSDLFSPPGYAEGLTALAARGHEIVVLHVLSPDEVDPPLGGDLRLLDVETGEPQEVTIDAPTRALYRRRLAEWRDEIAATCRARDAHYVPLVTDTPFEQVLLHDLRRVGVIR